LVIEADIFPTICCALIMHELKFVEIIKGLAETISNALIE
jgi:hypothetical protein